MDKISEKSIIVFYHAECIDGFTGAWAAWKKFGDKAEYIPFYHETNPPQISGKEIYTIDMAFPRDITEQMMRSNVRVTSIDHHISKKDVTLMTHEPLFDNDHSGCVLAWKYFFPEIKIPQFLLYVEDYDIWLHKYKSKQLYMYLNLIARDFSSWDTIIADFENEQERHKIIAQGEVLQEYEDKVIEHNIRENARLVSIDGYTVYCINTLDTPSAVAKKLIARQGPFAIIWEEKSDGKVHVHLRGEGDIDLVKIAEKYGGGGHKLAAAFRLKSLQDIPWKPV